MAGRVVTKTNAASTATIVWIRQSMPDSEAQNPVNGKTRSKETIRDRPVWTAYLIVRARFMAPQTSHPIIQIEIARFLNKLAN